MPSTIDLEREFFKATRNLEKYEEAREQFLARINEISGKWIDNKFRLGVLGLGEKEKLGSQVGTTYWKNKQKIYKVEC